MDGETPQRTSLRILALGGIAGPVLFSAVVIISAARQDGDYSHVHNFISEMGADELPDSAFMNYAGFLPGGLLLAGFGIVLGMSLPTHRSSIAGAFCVTLFGLGIAACGVFSCDPGCPLGDCTVENSLHNVIAPACFVCQIAGMITLGFLFRRLPEWRSLWKYSIVSGVLALVFLIGLVIFLKTDVYKGLFQRLMLGTMFVWCGIVGWKVFRCIEDLKRHP